MDFETSPSAKCDSPESVADDNHSEKTGSEGSEGFVKGNIYISANNNI